MDGLRPSESEVAFLTLAYQRFYCLFDEIMEESFWDKDPWYRFSKIANGFGIYAELLNYEPIKWVIEHLKATRPPMEAEIGSDLFRFIRNVVIHFPVFGRWDDIWVSKSLINWHREGQSIDRFLATYSGRPAVKYRFWESARKRMTYLSIKFPVEYAEATKIYLRDIVAEKESIMFCFVLMKQVMDTQVERGEPEAPR